MELYPAIDLRDGGAVRLTQGDFSRTSVYGDPVALAIGFASSGAPWLHVVDLDAARTGRPANRATVLEIASSVAVPVQAGGGVRSLDDVAELVAGGVARVVFGTAALEDPGLVRAAAAAYGPKVAVGLDYRRGAGGRLEVAVRGWTASTGATVEDTLDVLEDEPLGAVVVTAIDRDGTLTGPDVDGLAAVLAVTRLPVVASGGVSGVSDLLALGTLSVDPGGGAAPRRLLGAISGKALVEGRFTVEEGVAACGPSA